MKHRNRMGRFALALLLGVVALPMAVAATETKTLRIGGLELWYDAERWRADAAGADAVTMEPVGVLAGKLDPVRVTRASYSGDDACERLARSELPGDMYEEPSVDTVDVAGVKALRMTAPTRCRNAMPNGVAICMRAGGNTFLFTASRPGCRSGANNLFSGSDPLAELVESVQFAE
jgi:hypothetical protein